MAKQTVIVKQDEQEPIAAEIIAKALIEIAEATKKMLRAGLKYETIVTLVAAHSGVSKKTCALSSTTLRA